MNRFYNSSLISSSRKLRKNMTKEERHLWYDFLKQYPVPFNRQKVLGQYIADFYCASAKLAIELDGSQHYEESAKEYDQKRTAYIQDLGVYVLRFPNNEVMKNFRGVCECIDAVVKESLSEKRLPLEEKLSAKLTDEVSKASP